MININQSMKNSINLKKALLFISMALDMPGHAH